MTDYSHGLEKIYAFETINPQTVRLAAVQQETSLPRLKSVALPPLALTFDFGPYFQEAIPNLRLKEPLSSLALTPFALKGLFNRNIRSVGEALRLLESDPSTFKALGQGHIEEIREKIAAFLGKNPLECVSYVDWESLVRYLTADLEAKERYVLLKRYALEELASASPTDLQELLRLSDEQIQKLYQKSEEAVKSTHGASLEKTLEIIAEAFLKPYLRRQEGFATGAELMERLQKVSLQQMTCRNVFSFLQALTNPLPLIKLSEEAVYAQDVETKLALEEVICQAKSYYNPPFTSYPLPLLTRYLLRDFAAFGSKVSARYIERLFDCSSHFLIQHDSKYSLTVSLNWRQDLSHLNSPHIG